jgi:pSer/pThr/pTyr-binding forkhead associated (FHA) protein
VTVFLELMGYSVEVPHGETVIGRDIGCALRFNDSAISRRHVRIVRTGEEVVIEDLGSTNGTLLNGKPLAGRVTLAHRDTIGLGSNVLQFVISDASDEEPSTRRLMNLRALGAVVTRHSAKRQLGTVKIPALASRTRSLTLEPDRRRAERRAFEFRLVYASSELEIEATTRDLSESGVFVCCEVLDPVGTACELTLLIEAGPPLQLRGIVRRVVDVAGPEPIGLGIEFVDLDDDQRSWLEIAISQLAPTEAHRKLDP